MNTDENKKKIIILFIALGMIFTIITGITFSYLAPTINNLENESTVAFNAGVIAIDFKNGTSQIEVSDILPGWSETKKFSLIATNTTSIKKADAMNYSLKLIVESNTFSDNAISVSLKSTNTSNNGTIAEIIPGTLLSGASEFSLGFGSFDATKEIGEAGATHDFELTVSFPEQYRSQNSDMGKHLSAHVTIGKEKQTISEYISKLDKASNGLEEDNTTDKNIRYTGANPNNYVEFGNDNELWRIVGVFNVKDSTGKIERKIKLVRNESLGDFSWDATGNDNYGFNNWTEADLKNELNGDYLNTALTSNKNNWYNSYLDSSTNKPLFRQTGVFDYTKVIKSNYQNMISESVWNIGGNTYSNPSMPPFGLPLLDQYNKERGTITYQNSRPTEWTGKVGLIYASDYGYASTNSECRENLRAGVTYENGSWDYSNGKCKTDNWLAKSTCYWTLSPFSVDSPDVLAVDGDGAVTHHSAYISYSVWPAVFLKSDILIAGGTGEKDNPYHLG